MPPFGEACVCNPWSHRDPSGLVFFLHYGRGAMNTLEALPLCCHIPEGRLGNVPAIFHFEWREAKPRTSLSLAFLHVRRHLVVRSIDAFLLELLAT